MWSDVVLKNKNLYPSCANVGTTVIPKVKEVFNKITETRRVMQTKPLIEQHFHGCFGVDFNKASVDEILFLSKEITKQGIGGIFPSLVTDSVKNIQTAIARIKEAASRQQKGMAKILGIHLEGIFISPNKKGIHNPEYLLPLTVENYKLVEDDFIKIVTLAPELDRGLIDYLVQKGVKVQAGHCEGSDLTGCSGVTHIFNAMSGLDHRQDTTLSTALTDDNLYTEVIADGIHVSDMALKLLFKSKPEDKILLISDSLPCTKSDLKQIMFCDKPVFIKDGKATSSNGTIAGSTQLLPDIIKRLNEIGLFKSQYIENPYNYHGIDIPGSVEWDEKCNIVDISI